MSSRWIRSEPLLYRRAARTFRVLPQGSEGLRINHEASRLRSWLRMGMRCPACCSACLPACLCLAGHGAVPCSLLAPCRCSLEHHLTEIRCCTKTRSSSLAGQRRMCAKKGERVLLRLFVTCYLPWVCCGSGHSPLCLGFLPEGNARNCWGTAGGEEGAGRKQGLESVEQPEHPDPCPVGWPGQRQGIRKQGTCAAGIKSRWHEASAASVNHPVCKRLLRRQREPRCLHAEAGHLLRQASGAPRCLWFS